MATVLERILGIEKRSGETSGLTNPAEWLSVLLGAGPTRTKIAINPQTAVTIATVFACVRVLSEDLAKIPLEVLEDLGPDESRPAPDQPAYRLLNIEPNPEMDAMILRETATAQMLLWGNGYLEVVRNGAGMPVEVWPLLSGNCVPMRVYDRGAWGRVVYSYQDPEGRRKPARIPAEDVIHLKCLGGDGTMGWSVVRMARESFGLSAAADGFGAAFFGNGARPGGVLEHPGKLNPAAQDTIRASWNKIHGGVDNANNIAILAEGMKFSPYSMPNNEAQFLETRRFQVEEICRWFRVPPQKVADHSRSTFGNVEEINAQYADDSLGGWMRRWEGEGRRKLFTQDQMMRYRLEHNEAELRRGRLKDRYDSYAIGRQWGWLSPNDILRMEGRNPLPAEIGDVYLVPSNMTTPDRMAMAAAAGDPKQPPATPAEAGARSALVATAVVEGFRPVLEAAYRSVVRIEVDRARRGAKGGGAKAWAEGFYPDHRDHVRGVVFPIVESMAAAVKASAGLTLDVAGLVGELADAHCKRSRDELATVDPAALEATLSGWEGARPAIDSAADLRTVQSKVQAAVGVNE